MILLKVRLKPNSKKTEIIGNYNDGIKIAVKAPAVDNKANETLIQFLSEHYQISKAQIEIIKGLKSKNKVLRINK